MGLPSTDGLALTAQLALLQGPYEWTSTVARSGLRLLGILVVALLAARLLGAVTQRLVKAAASDSRAAVLREQHTRTLASLLNSIGGGLIFAAAVLTALAEVGIDVTPVTAFAALASLGVGLGAQHVIRDVISGFVLVFEDQYAVGDVVRIDGIQGRVEHISLRRTVLRDTNGAIITCANGEIRRVANLSRDWSQADVDVPVPDGAGVQRAFALLEEVAAEMRSDDTWRAALLDGPRVLGIEAMAREGTTLRLQVRTAPTRQVDVARELRRRVVARFEAEFPRV